MLDGRGEGRREEKEDVSCGIPSTAANATSLSAKVPSDIHLRAQSAFFFTQGMVSIARNSRSFSCGFLMYVSIKRLYREINDVSGDSVVISIPVSLGVYILHCNLEPIEATSFRNLNLLHESCGEVLIDNSITSSKERKNIGDEVLLIFVEFLIPVNQVRLEVYLLRGPEAGLCCLVHSPYFLMFDGEEHKALVVGSEKEFSSRHVEDVVWLVRLISRMFFNFPFYPTRFPRDLLGKPSCKRAKIQIQKRKQIDFTFNLVKYTKPRTTQPCACSCVMTQEEAWLQVITTSVSSSVCIH